MKLVWDLTSFFENKEEVEISMKDIQNRVNILKNDTYNEISSNRLNELLDSVTEIKKLCNNILVYCSLLYYKNVNDAEIENLKVQAEKFVNEINTSLRFIDLIIINLGKNKIFNYISENPKLLVYEHYLDNLFRINRTTYDSTAEKVKLNSDKINDELSKYNTLLKNIKYGNISINGEEINVTGLNVGKYLSFKDRNVRKQAFNLLNNAYKKNEDSFASILNNILKYRIFNAKIEGYDSVLEKALFDENISSDVVITLIKNVEKNLDLMQKYLQLKTKVLEIEDPHLHDFGACLVSEIDRTYSIEEAIRIIKEALAPLGKEYLEIIDILLNGHVDAEMDENKHQSIIFSWNTYSFMNYKGGYADIKNLIHELGHIVNYYLSMKNQIYLYEDSTIFVGEVSALVNEILLNKYFYNNAKNDTERIFYLSKSIENMITTIFKQTMYTEFQKNLFELRKETEISTDMFSLMYLNIIKKYYGENIYYGENDCIEWTRLGHLFRYAYYNFKYATGLLIANTIVDFLIDKKSINKEDYIKFLSLGSSMYSLNLIKTLNIDLTDDDIIKSGFSVFKDNIENLERILMNRD